MAENFNEIEEWKKVKEANEEKEGGSVGRSGGAKQEEEKQLKQPTGDLPNKVSSEYTPLMAQDLASNMKLYIRTCTIWTYSAGQNRGHFVSALLTPHCGPR